MEFSVNTNHLAQYPSSCVVVGVFENQILSNSAQQLDLGSEGYLSTLLRTGDLEGKAEQTLLLHQVPKLACARVLLVGCAKESELNDKIFRDIVRKAMNTVLQTGASDMLFCLSELSVKNRDTQWKIRQAVMLMLETLYTFDQFKTQKETRSNTLSRVIFNLSNSAEISSGEQAIVEGQAIAEGVSFTKNLANLPPNICTPSYLAKEAETLAAQFPKLSAKIFNEQEIAALKMGAFSSVGQGSQNPPRFIILEYRGAEATQKPIVLVGKAITFDTGGNSLKGKMNMIGMKYDMCGGASVLASLRAAAELNLPLNIIGVIPSAENMPGNTASRPDDIVTTLSGLTVEILDTDAEGRLILCDALSYCERFNPEVVIDIATLTGACVAALGSQTSGLFGNHTPLIQDLRKAGEKSGDRCWELPLWEEYQEALNSNFADVANIGNPPDAGAILAGCFLSRFTKNFHWAHLDVAGTAFRSYGKERGATGRPVPLLIQYLLDRCYPPQES